ncbi:hypothetical protein QYM36_019742 [Artemia franciscana]|uniref:Uncharacterized protein n=1 Tax=Artemia franciscana TaxID=6661 RepID=A0AA88KZ40_ARTSF|nr:hypothetical protein QYM36_019742 [Artemia franciscana]
MKSNHLDIVESEIQKIGQLTSSSKENAMRVFNTLDESDKEGRDNLLIHHLIEAISRATTRATIVYTNGDQLLSGIAQQFKEHTPQIMPEGG